MLYSIDKTSDERITPFNTGLQAHVNYDTWSTKTRSVSTCPSIQIISAYLYKRRIKMINSVM
jgi:hypothetical protein